MDFTKEETYRLTRVPVQLAHTLTPEAYRSTAYFEIERERVFATSWVCVGYTSQLAEPGDTLVASVADQPIFVVRDRQARADPLSLPRLGLQPGGQAPRYPLF